MWLACLLSVLLGILLLCQIAILIIFYSSRNVQVGQYVVPWPHYWYSLFRLWPEKTMTQMRMIGFPHTNASKLDLQTSFHLELLLLIGSDSTAWPGLLGTRRILKIMAKAMLRLSNTGIRYDQLWPLYASSDQRLDVLRSASVCVWHWFALLS